MGERKSFLVRIDATVLDGIQRWANDDLRSMNAQIEYLLRDALRRVGRLPRPETAGAAADATDSKTPVAPDDGPDVA